MITAAQARATIERYVDRHTAGDIDGILECFSADAVAEDPVGTPPHVGRDALRTFFEGTHALCDRLDLELTGTIRVAGANAAFPMKANSHIGDDVISVEIIDVMTFDDDGRITTMKAYWGFE
ncbi:MAG TPA: nuclear transport factor 2 family protein [Microthrixaceae bacterium]|nr:nuclear transport factor 2 family protein [Microthrixaceae bacterium]